MEWKERIDELTAQLTAFLWKTFSDRKNLFRFAFAAAAIIIVSQLMPAITIASFWVAFLLIVVSIGLLVGARPALAYIKLPFSILTFGLFLWISNTLILYVLDWLLWYLETSTWWWVILYALVQAVINCLIETLVQEE